MQILMNLLISSIILKFIGINIFLYLLKKGVKKFLNIDIDYKKYFLWLLKIIKNIFESWT